MDMKNQIKKDIHYYLNLPWTYTVETMVEEGEKIYIVHVNELPGISTDAQTLTEAMDLIKDAMIAAINLYLEQGEEVPEPIDESQFKGNIAYRTSSKRHYSLVREAKKKNLSISQIIDRYVDQGENRRS